MSGHAIGQRLRTFASRLGHCSRGASIVETAFVFALVLIPAILATAEGANLVMQRQGIERHAREAVGHLSQYPGIWDDADEREDWISALEQRSGADLNTGTVYFACPHQVVASGASAPRVSAGSSCAGTPPSRYVDLTLRKSYRELFYNPWGASPGTTPLSRTFTVQLGLPAP